MQKLSSSAASEARLTSESSQRDLMKRLFPDVTLTSDEKDHEKWFEDFATAVNKVRFPGNFYMVLQFLCSFLNELAQP